MLEEHLSLCLQSVTFLGSTELVTPLVQVGVHVVEDKAIKCCGHFPCIHIVDERVLQARLLDWIGIGLDLGNDSLVLRSR